MPRATLRIEDPRISEAHALVSLRGAALKLLALRGRLTWNGKSLTEIALRPTMRVLLGGFYPLVVTDVTVPSTVLALTVPGLPPTPVDGVLAVHFDPSGPRVARGFDPVAPVTVWASEAGLQVRSGPDQHVVPAGADVLLGPGCSLGAALVPNDVEARATAEPGRFDVPLRIVLHYDTVHIHPAQGATVALDGIGARLITELASLGTPVAWDALARELWPGESDAGILRQRWDQITSRLRKRLRDARVRDDLVRANRQGLVELYLGPGDRVEDHA